MSGVTYSGRARVVVDCPQCEYQRFAAGRNRRTSGLVAGHCRGDCGGQPEIRAMQNTPMYRDGHLVCESCGYDARDTDVARTGGRYQEPALCSVCRAYRRQRCIRTGLRWLNIGPREGSDAD